MKRFRLLLTAAVLVTGALSAQNAAELSGSNKTVTYTALKPADGQPAVFSTKADLKKAEDKKQGILAEIAVNKDNPEKVKELREQLWRFENAIVIEQTTNK